MQLTYYFNLIYYYLYNYEKNSILLSVGGPRDGAVGKGQSDIHRPVGRAGAVLQAAHIVRQLQGLPLGVCGGSTC